MVNNSEMASLLPLLRYYSRSRTAGRPATINEDVIFKLYVIGRLEGLTITQIALRVGMSRSAFSHRLHNIKEMKMLKNEK